MRKPYRLYVEGVRISKHRTYDEGMAEARKWAKRLPNFKVELAYERWTWR